MDIPQWSTAVLLSISSSTDNFLVGVTLGISTASTSEKVSVDNKYQPVPGVHNELEPLPALRADPASPRSPHNLEGHQGQQHPHDPSAAAPKIPFSSQQLRRWLQLNLIVALCNATGALLATHGGKALHSINPNLSAWLAGCAFLYLGREEAHSWWNDEPSPLGKMANSAVTGRGSTTLASLRLAVPMTLNNLAGGVAGGAAGVPPILNACCMFLASALMMGGGLLLGVGSVF